MTTSSRYKETAHCLIQGGGVINDTGKIGYQNGRALMLKLSYYAEKISEKLKKKKI